MSFFLALFFLSLLDLSLGSGCHQQGGQDLVTHTANQAQFGETTYKPTASVMNRNIERGSEIPDTDLWKKVDGPTIQRPTGRLDRDSEMPDTKPKSSVMNMNVERDSEMPDIDSSWKKVDGPVIDRATGNIPYKGVVLFAGPKRPEPQQMLRPNPEVDNPLMARTLNYAFAFWMKLDSYRDGWNSIFQRTNGRGKYPRYPGLWITGNGIGEPGRLHMTVATTENQNANTMGKKAIPLNQWVHVYVVVNDWEQYVEHHISSGKFETIRTPLKGRVINEKAEFWMGAPAYPSVIDGEIADFRFINHARTSQSEIEWISGLKHPAP